MQHHARGLGAPRAHTRPEATITPRLRNGPPARGADPPADPPTDVRSEARFSWFDRIALALRREQRADDRRGRARRLDPPSQRARARRAQRRDSIVEMQRDPLQARRCVGPQPNVEHGRLSHRLAFPHHGDERKRGAEADPRVVRLATGPPWAAPPDRYGLDESAVVQRNEVQGSAVLREQALRFARGPRSGRGRREARHRRRRQTAPTSRRRRWCGRGNRPRTRRARCSAMRTPARERARGRRFAMAAHRT